MQRATRRKLNGRGTGWGTALTLWILLPLATSHVCDSHLPNTLVCDPATQGTTFFWCWGLGWTHAQFFCPDGLVFNELTDACDWPENVPVCSLGESPTPTSSTATPTTTITSTTTTAHPITPSPATLQTTTTTTTTTTSPEGTSTTPIPSEPRTTTTLPTATGSTGNPCAGKPSDVWICDPLTAGTTFLRCLEGEPHRYHCPSGTFFNQKLGTCDWSENIEVMCVAGGSSSQSTGPTSPRPTGDASTTTTSTTTTTSATPAGPCSDQTCQLPHCRCVSTDIPGHVPTSQVPQMVLLTFDDYISWANFHYYQDLFLRPESEMFRNPNNCSIGATFFVSYQGTNMTQVKMLWDNGHEVASHSMTHNHTQSWNASLWKKEMQGMREKLAGKLNVPVYEIGGMRTPFLELGGETQYNMMREQNFTYDTSMFGGSLKLDTVTNPVWPFTLHYPPDYKVCDQLNCPKNSHPGVWEVPLIRQYAPDGRPCSMTDSCPLRPGAGPDDVSAFLRQNFQRHYQANRAPFMISLHATWFSNVPGSLQGLKDFLKEVEAQDDVWVVTVTQMLDWVRHPVSRDRLHELPSWEACV